MSVSMKVGENNLGGFHGLSVLDFCLLVRYLPHFETEKEMKAHEREHDSAKYYDYKCEHCLILLSSSKIVKLHRIKRTCDNCKQLFNCAGEWQTHKTTSTCEKCNKILICWSEKLLHETTNRNRCVYCNTTLPCGSIVQQHESDSSIEPILSTIFYTPALKDVRCVYCAYCDFQKEGHTLLEACSYCKSHLPFAILQKGHEQINTCEHCAKYFTCPKQKEDHIRNEHVSEKIIHFWQYYKENKNSMVTKTPLLEGLYYSVP